MKLSSSNLVLVIKKNLTPAQKIRRLLKAPRILTHKQVIMNYGTDCQLKIRAVNIMLFSVNKINQTWFFQRKSLINITKNYFFKYILDSKGE